jgi:hypothetical protein
MSTLSLEYVRVRVQATESGAAQDPTGDTVAMAFVAAAVNPGGTDWKTASWETDTTTTPDTYYARCLVGPAGTVTLAAGTYDVWVKVTDSPEIPALRAGSLEVF